MPDQTEWQRLREQGELFAQHVEHLFRPTTLPDTPPGVMTADELMAAIKEDTQHEH